MTQTYQIQARCFRPFNSWIEIEADTPEQALDKARLEDDELIAAAEDSESWPWDEFTVCNQGGKTLLHVREEDACLRDAAPTLLESLNHVKAILMLRHIDEAGDDEVKEALGMADEVIAQAGRCNGAFRVQRSAAALLLDMVRYGAIGLGDGEAAFNETIYAFDYNAPDWHALLDAIGWDAATAAIRERAAA
jgi:hypothetical protein